MMGEQEIADAKRLRPRAGERVSAAADRLFYERGIRAVGIEEIVSTAGVTKPSLYRSYASKDALVSHCLEARFAQAMADMDAMEARVGGDPLEMVREVVRYVATEMQCEGYRGCALTNAAVEFPDCDHPVRRHALELKGRKRQRLLGYASRLPTDRPEQLVDAIILLLEGARAVSHISGTCGPAASLTVAADAVIAGFLRDPACAPPPKAAG